MDNNTLTVQKENELRRNAKIHRIQSPAFAYSCVLGLAIALTVFGVIMVFSSSSVELLASGIMPYANLLSQGAFGAIGIFAMLFVARYNRITPRTVRKLSGIFLIFTISLQLITVLSPLGKQVNGNKNWLDVGMFSFQPSELIKLAVILWLALQLSLLKKITSFKQLIPAGIGSIFAVGSILLGKDLGSAAIVLLIVLFALFMSPCKPLYFISVLLVSAAGIAGFFVVGDKMRMTRMFATYFGCGDDYGGACYQSIHGIYALGTGGLWGTGLGSSKEKWSYLPEAHNDFIFAIIGEELGFVVCSLVILAFVFMLLATIRIAVSLTNRFERTTVLLIGFWIFVQAMINIGVVLGVLPVIGIPLPFISAGGSSLIITLASVGIVLCFAKSNEEVAAKLQWRKAFRRFRQLFGK